MILTGLAIAPAITWAQHLSGALGVSLVVLPPASTHPVKVISFRVDEDGVARLETTSPVTGTVSAIVMSTVSSSPNGFIPLEQTPALVSVKHRGEPAEAARDPADSPAPLLRFEMELDAESVLAGTHDVKMRMTYLVVPGT